jgi:putative endonuclease
MEEYFIYILYSQSKNRYYIGSCADIAKRLEKHNDGATPSTKPGRLWKVVYIEMYIRKAESAPDEFAITEINEVPMA